MTVTSTDLRIHQVSAAQSKAPSIFTSLFRKSRHAASPDLDDSTEEEASSRSGPPLIPTEDDSSPTLQSNVSTPQVDDDNIDDDSSTEVTYEEHGTIIGSVASSSAAERQHKIPQLLQSRRPAKDYSSGSEGIPFGILQDHASSRENSIIGSTVLPRNRPVRVQSDGSGGLASQDLHGHTRSSLMSSCHRPGSLIVGNYDADDGLRTVDSQSLSLTPTMVERAMYGVNDVSFKPKARLFRSERGEGIHVADSSEKKNNSDQSPESSTSSKVAEEDIIAVAAPTEVAVPRPESSQSSQDIDSKDEIPLPSTLEPDMVLCPFCQREKELTWNLHQERRDYRVAYQVLGVAVVLALMAGSYAFGTRQNLEPILEAHIEHCQRMFLEQQQLQIERHEQQLQMAMQQQQLYQQQLELGFQKEEQQQHYQNQQHQLALIRPDVVEGGDFLSTLILTALGGAASGMAGLLASFFLEDAGEAE